MQKKTHPGLPSKKKPKHGADIQEEHDPCVCSKSKIFYCIVHTSDNNNTVLCHIFVLLFGTCNIGSSHWTGGNCLMRSTLGCKTLLLTKLLS